MIVAALGDSLSGGYFAGGTYIHDPDASYPLLVAQHLGATQLGIVAIAGALIETIAESIPQLPPASDLLILNAGTNDMVHVASGLKDLAEVRDLFDGILRLSRGWMPQARIVIVGLRDVSAMDPEHIPGPHAIRRLVQPENFHASASAFNEHILTLPGTTPVELAHRTGSDAIELFPDAIHPSPLGVRWLADAVIEAL